MYSLQCLVGLLRHQEMRTVIRLFFLTPLPRRLRWEIVRPFSLDLKVLNAGIFYIFDVTLRAYIYIYKYYYAGIIIAA